jgi:hypothetical protein
VTKQGDYDAEIARLDALQDTGHELDGAIRVEVVTPKSARDVFSLRISAAELTEVAAAARSRGQNLSEFIRNAALKEARGSDGTERRWVDPQVAEALDELVRRIDEGRGEKRRRRAS